MLLKSKHVFIPSGAAIIIGNSMKVFSKIKHPSLIFLFIMGLMLNTCTIGICSDSIQPIKFVSIVLPKNAGVAMKNIASIISLRIEERSGAKVIASGKADLKIKLLIKPGIGVEGFTITSDENSIQITGNDQRGVVYGVGKFLRISGYCKDGFSPGKWAGTSVPEKSVRGIYLATHFYNFYQTAPINEVQRYIEDIALWGVNTITVWYDMHHFKGFDDPEAVSFRHRLKQFSIAARKLDIGIGFIVVGNEGYANSPVNLQAIPGGSRGGYYPTDICPNKSGGMEYILKTKEQFFNWCQDIKPEYICIWPYDQGGCGSIDCQPWGANGFIKCAKRISEMARKKIKGVKIIISTWYFDSTELKVLSKQINKDQSWVNVIMAEDIPGYESSNFLPLAGKLQTIGFSEISMYNTFPWGGFGATPLPNHLLSQWHKVQNKLDGGFPYSEGIFDDISKVTHTQLYWSSTTSIDQILKEYISYEYSPQVGDSILKVIKTLEQNHHMRWWPGELEGVRLTLDWFPSKNAKPQTDPGAEEAYAIVRQVDITLPEWARKSWRWRILYIRTMLDAELKANGGSPNDACINGFKELMNIYHTTEKTDPVVRPPVPRGNF